MVVGPATAAVAAINTASSYVCWRLKAEMSRQSSTDTAIATTTKDAKGVDGTLGSSVSH